MTQAKTKRIVLINRDFQLRYARSAVIVGLISTVLTVTLLLYPLFHFGIIRFPNFLPYPFLVGMLLAAALNFALVAYFGILMTHRIAGPMFSLVRQFRAVTNGDLRAQFKIRDDDEMKFVVRNFNEMMESLSAMAGRDLEKVDKLLAGLDSDREGARQAALALRSELKSRLEGSAGTGAAEAS